MYRLLKGLNSWAVEKILTWLFGGSTSLEIPLAFFMQVCLENECRMLAWCWFCHEAMLRSGARVFVLQANGCATRRIASPFWGKRTSSSSKLACRFWWKKKRITLATSNFKHVTVGKCFSIAQSGRKAALKKDRGKNTHSLAHSVFTSKRQELYDCQFSKRMDSSSVSVPLSVIAVSPAQPLHSVHLCTPVCIGLVWRPRTTCSGSEATPTHAHPFDKKANRQRNKSFLIQQTIGYLLLVWSPSALENSPTAMPAGNSFSYDVNWMQ